MAMTCKLCGTEIKENETVCSLCGTAVENTSVPAVEETSAPVVETPAPTVEEVKPESVATVPAAESKFVCSGCGKEYPNGGKFCAECGGKIEDKKRVVVQKDEAPKFVCTGCGKEYPAGTKFCSECGGKIEEKKPVIVQKEEAPKFACTGCGKEYPAGTKFCSECGGKVAEKSAAQPLKKIVCTKCGKEYPDSGKFCSECGGKIEEKVIYPNDAPTFYRVILTSFGNNEDRFEEVMYERVNIYDFEKDFFFDKIILAHAILMEDAEKLVSVVEKAGGKALIEEFSEIPDPDGVVYECRDCGELYDHDVTVCNSCDNETIEKRIRKDVWFEYYENACGVALLHKKHRYFCRSCHNYSTTPGKCCGKDLLDTLQANFCQLLDKNHNATADYLLNKHPDLADGKSYDTCPWIYIRDIELAQKLLKKCTDINSSLLHVSGSGIRYLRTVEFAKLIIDAGANKDALTHLLGSIHVSDDIPFARALINAGADPELDTQDAWILGTDVEVVRFWLDNGADPNVCDGSWNVLNAHLQEANDLKIIELLLQRGADPNMLTEQEELDEEDNVIGTYQETSLEFALESGLSLEHIKLLIKYGADVNVKHYDGRSLVDMALDNGDVEIAELLKQHGAVAHETPMTAAEIAEQYFHATELKWFSRVFFAPNIPSAKQLYADTIVLISDQYQRTHITKSGIHICPVTDGKGALDRLFNMRGESVKSADLSWQEIFAITYTPNRQTEIRVNNILIYNWGDKFAQQFTEYLKNYAREQGAQL